MLFFRSGTMRLFAFLCLVLTLLALADAYRFVTLPAQAGGQETSIYIRPGQGMREIAADLQKQGLITSSLRFCLLARALKKSGRIQAGEFVLSSDMVPVQILQVLTSGKAVQHSLTVQEGLTWWQTAEVVEKSGFCSKADFAAAVHDQQLLQNFGILAENAEGFLFPSTYYFLRDQKQNATIVVGRMLQTFQSEIRQILPDSSWEQLFELVTKASLVEKETAVAEERAKIAGVYANRLRRNMLLQCDPTVIYGLGPLFDGNLTRYQLKDKRNKYNTYKHAGLPPGPICSSGLAALQAAAMPEKHDFLYFVATGNGSHVFSRSLREHNRAVRKYQLHR